MFDNIYLKATHLYSCDVLVILYYILLVNHVDAFKKLLMIVCFARVTTLKYVKQASHFAVNCKRNYVYM